MKGAFGVVIAAGIRPCSGAIVVLVLALAGGVFWAGVAAAYAMAAGTELPAPQGVFPRYVEPAAEA